MKITNELRKWMRARGMMAKETFDQLTAIADRIDAEHDREMIEIRTRGWSNGYDEGFASADDWLAQHEDAMAEHGWVKLPVDADGETIHIGDEMEGVDKYDSLKEVRGKVITVSFESDGIVDVAIQAWNDDGRSWHRAYLDPDASVYRHYHAPTVEDVLREFAQKMNENLGMYTGEAIDADEWRDADAKTVAEYAAKLRLAGDAE